MKKAIIRFKEITKGKRGYEVYYKEIPKILLRYYFHKLNKRGCWDIEVIDIENIAKTVDRMFKNATSEELEYIQNDRKITRDYINHIPRID